MATRVPVTIRVNGRPAPSTTLFAAVGAYVIVLETTTASPRAVLTVSSTYVAHQSTDTHATHIVMCAGAEARIDTRMHAPGELPVDARERRACLYDHLQQVLAALRTGRRPASIDVFEHGAQVLDA